MKYTFLMFTFVAACAAPAVGEVTDTATGAQSTATEDESASESSSQEQTTKDGGVKEDCEDGGGGKRGH